MAIFIKNKYSIRPFLVNAKIKIMSLSGREKKYLKKNLKKKSIEQISKDLNVSPDKLTKYLKKIWGKEKYQRKTDYDNDQYIWETV